MVCRFPCRVFDFAKRLCPQKDKFPIWVLSVSIGSGAAEGVMESMDGRNGMGERAKQSNEGVIDERRRRALRARGRRRLQPKWGQRAATARKPGEEELHHPCQRTSQATDCLPVPGGALSVCLSALSGGPQDDIALIKTSPVTTPYPGGRFRQKATTSTPYLSYL